MNVHLIKSACALFFFSIVAVSLVCLTTNLCCKNMKPFAQVDSLSDAVNLFPKTTDDINQIVVRVIDQAHKDIDTIIAIPESERTFLNTAKAFDNLVGLSDFLIAAHTIGITQMVHPDKAMRDAAQQAVIKLEQFSIDNISDNVELYGALKQYVEGNAAQENLNDEQRYFLQQTMEDFKRAGLDLSPAERADVKKLKKEIGELVNQFDANIAQDNSTIVVKKEQLAGLEDDFVDHLKRTESGDYILGVDYPTIQNVMENCTHSDTRKKLLEAFANRAYPTNEKLLNAIIAKRDELARKLGFESYAHLDLDDQMVGKPDRAQKFLDALVEKVKEKERAEFELLVADLPDTITITQDRKMNAWDTAFVKTAYRKKHFNIDEREIAQYFPMEKAVAGLFDIYEQFLSLSLKQVPVSGLWHEDVSCVEVRKASNNQLLGYLFLDLYPRANKYSHACHADVVPTYIAADGSEPPSVSVVIANFPQSTSDKPSLLKRSDVSTFFHEFGHALHSILGRTQMAAFAGTNVKRDFVELPSQILEDWLYDRDMLKLVSSHYQTGEQLPDELIDKIIEMKNFDSGSWVQRQAYLSNMSLAYHLPGADKDLYRLMHDLHADICVHINKLDNDHMYASFGHLTGYGAKYYGYLWSKVFAKDLFAEIKKHGLLNPEIGQKYIDTVIGCGGSKDPNQLLKDFLGREPNQIAFMQDMGL